MTFKVQLQLKSCQQLLCTFSLFVHHIFVCGAVSAPVLHLRHLQLCSGSQGLKSKNYFLKWSWFLYISSKTILGSKLKYRTLYQQITDNKRTRIRAKTLGRSPRRTINVCSTCQSIKTKQADGPTGAPALLDLAARAADALVWLLLSAAGCTLNTHRDYRVAANTSQGQGKVKMDIITARTHTHSPAVPNTHYSTACGFIRPWK